MEQGGLKAALIVGGSSWPETDDLKRDLGSLVMDVPISRAPAHLNYYPSLSPLGPRYGADRLELRQIRHSNWRSSENCAIIAPTAFKRRHLSYALLHRHTQQYPGIWERSDAD